MGALGVVATVIGGIAAAGAAGAAVFVAAQSEGDESRQAAVLITRVIDGDTVEIGDDTYVRLIGIDSPEKGECGHQAATDALRELVEGHRVLLRNPEGVQDRDRYDRLLRYVDIDKTDAGFAQVKAGLADARYDGLDGYARHPRQHRYRDADQAVDSKCEEQERLRTERARIRQERLEQDARQAARGAGITPRNGETARHLLHRGRSAIAEQRRIAAAQERRRLAALAEQRRLEALAEQRRQQAAEEAQRNAEPGPPPTSGGFTPPPGWTTDALTPGYTGCRQGYPGGSINGVYVWKPIPC